MNNKKKLNISLDKRDAGPEIPDNKLLEKEKLKYLSKVVPLSTGMYLFTAFVLVLILRNHVDKSLLIYWYSSVFLVSSARFFISVLFNRQKEKNHKTFYSLFVLMMLLSAFVWGFSGFVLLTDDYSVNMFIIVCILGIGTGSTVTLASDLKQVFLFLSFLVIPFTARLFLLDAEYYKSAAVLLLIYYFMILGIGNKFYKIIYENIYYAWISRKTTDELTASEKKFRTIFKHAPVGIFYYDMDLVIYDCNEEFCSIVETSIDNMINFNMNSIRDKRILQALQDAVNEETGFYEGDYHTTISSSKKWIAMKCSPVYDRNGVLTGAVGILQDRTEYQLIEEKVRHLAYHDSLTGLPNRLLLKDRTGSALARARRTGCMGAILFLDLDNFKVINDTLGHHVGDKILIETAERIKSIIRAEDTVSRIGGDEFIVLLPRLQNNTEEAIRSASFVADKIHKKLSQPYKMVEKKLYTSTSIGISLFSGNDLNIDDLLKNADTAMYEAKRSGRSCTHYFNEEMNVSIEKRMKLESSLRHAVENKEFVLNFQPIYDFKEKKYAGAEALIRWLHPEMGIVSPSDFIPLAEETGLILPMGEWIIEEVCKKLEEWNNKFSYPLKYVSINISVTQLKQDNFSELLLNNIQKYNIPPEMIVLEITENVLIENIEKTAGTVSDLRKLDISFALDDFGTGYSSLTYLKNLALNIIKIDRAFIRDIINDENDSALVEAILSISGNFNMQVVAEGVEDEDQAEKLAGLGCRYHQGFFYSKPLPSADFEEILAKN